MTTDKRTIALDIDDVLVDMNETMRLWSNRVSGVELTPEQYQMPAEYWGYYERVWETYGLKGLSYDDFEADLIADQLHVPVLAGASFAIEELQKQFHVILITSRNTELERQTRAWVKAHLPGDIDIYFAKNNRLKSGRSKGELCVELGAFMLIDDNVEHITSALNEGVEAILFGDYGWQPSIPNGAIRCSSWPAVLEVLNGRAE